jgi:hypothetical protein
MADLNVHSGTLNQLAAVINDVLRRLKTNASPILLAFIVVYLWREPGEYTRSVEAVLCILYLLHAMHSSILSLFLSSYSTRSIYSKQSSDG